MLFDQYIKAIGCEFRNYDTVRTGRILFRIFITGYCRGRRGKKYGILYMGTFMITFVKAFTPAGSHAIELIVASFKV